jgi:hypothetical protein
MLLSLGVVADSYREMIIAKPPGLTNSPGRHVDAAESPQM